MAAATTVTSRTQAKSMPVQALSISGLSVWVEGKPISVNAAYGSRKPGRTRSGKFIGPRYMTAEAQAWRDFVWLAFRMQPHQFATEQLPLRVHCTFYGVRADADNLLKLTLDGLKLALGIDDKHFSPVTAEVVRGKAAKAQGQGARIEVWACDERRGA